MNEMSGENRHLPKRLIQLTNLQQSNAQEAAVSITKAGTSYKIAIAAGIFNKIGATGTVQLALYEHGLVIACNHPEIEATFNPSVSGKKFIVYSQPLVLELCSVFNIQFLHGKTTVSFYNVIYDTEDGVTVAYVPLAATDESSGQLIESEA